VFREKVLENQSRSDDLDQALHLTNPLGWLVLVVVLTLLVSGLVWSTVADAPIKIIGQGILLSRQGVVEVVANNQGRVMDLAVAPGDDVRAEDVVAVIDQSDLELELSLAEAQLEATHGQYDRITEFHKRERGAKERMTAARISASRQSIKMAEERLKLLRQRDEGLGRLNNKGLVLRDKLIANQLEISQTIDQIAEHKNEIASLELESSVDEVDRERELLDILEKIDELDQNVRGLDRKLTRNHVVKSPFSGHVVEAKVNVGEYLNPGTPLFTLLREDDGAENGSPLMAVIYVPPADGKKIKVGMPVEIAPTTVKREEYGFLLGKVSHVAEVPSTTDGMMRKLKNDQLVKTLSGDSGAPFEVQVELLRDTSTPTGYRWSSSQGPVDAAINSGTLADAEVTVRTMKLAGLVIPALDRLFSDVRPEPETD